MKKIIATCRGKLVFEDDGSLRNDVVNNYKAFESNIRTVCSMEAIHDRLSAGICHDA